MSFSDIFKKSFLEGFASSDINIYTATVAMLTASLIALYIFAVYRVLTKKPFILRVLIFLLLASR